ncbi:hypothetical protein [Nocardia brasiliensis]|uniref:hypothetical protein n=1 Tax=Nocardia brasiliensis TaxID=37326 RepID=UPI000A9906CA|nr:hypothetical protein [Nocardia brasiliensis]
MMLPDEVAIFLNLLGIPWVNIDEEEVRRAADHIRGFVADVSSTIDDASTEITAMGVDYSGRSYEALLATWARLSGTHHAAFEVGGHAVATAMDVGADLIVAAKAAAIAELSALALGAGALLVTGGGAALQPLIQLAARRITWALKAYVEQYVLCELIERAISEFETEIDRIVDAAAEKAFDTASQLLGVHPASELRIDADEVLRRAQILESYADDIADHYRRFADSLAGIAIESGADSGDLSVSADAAVRQPMLPVESSSRPIVASAAFDRADQLTRNHTTPAVPESTRALADGRVQTSPDSDTEQPQLRWLSTGIQLPPSAVPVPQRGPVANTVGPSALETARSHDADSGIVASPDARLGHNESEAYAQTKSSTEHWNPFATGSQSRPQIWPVGHGPDLSMQADIHAGADTGSCDTSVPPVPPRPDRAFAKTSEKQNKSKQESQHKANSKLSHDRRSTRTPWSIPARDTPTTTPWTTTAPSRQPTIPEPESARDSQRNGLTTNRGVVQGL